MCPSKCKGQGQRWYDYKHQQNGARGHYAGRFNWLSKHLLRIKESLEPVLKNKGLEVDMEMSVSVLPGLSP